MTEHTTELEDADQKAAMIFPWREIKTAPKDRDRWVLATNCKQAPNVVRYRHTRDGIAYFGRGEGDAPLTYDYWMPIPMSPVEYPYLGKRNGYYDRIRSHVAVLRTLIEDDIVLKSLKDLINQTSDLFNKSCSIYEVLTFAEIKLRETDLTERTQSEIEKEEQKPCA